MNSLCYPKNDEDFLKLICAQGVSMADQNYFYTPNDPNETYQRYERKYDGSLQFKESFVSAKNYGGVGPKNYKRPDERIYEEICEVLTLDPDIDATEVEVDVKDGVVTLKGFVETKTLKRYAESAIEHIYGVKDIHNEITLPEKASGS